MEKLSDTMPGKAFSELIDRLVEENPEADVNTFFDARGVPMENRSNFVFGCCLTINSIKLKEKTWNAKNR